MQYHRYLLLTQEGHTLIQDETGAYVEFFSIEDFLRCSGIDFTGKIEIGYEPAINHFQDSEDPSFGPDDIPYAPFEQAIDDIALLLTRRDDATYNRTEAEAVPVLQQELVQATAATAADKREIAQNQPVAGFSPTIVGIYNEERVYRLNYINAKDAMGVALTQSEQDFLLQNKPFWEYMRDVSSVLSQAIDIIEAYTTIAECQAYNSETTPPWPTWTPPAPV